MMFFENWVTRKLTPDELAIATGKGWTVHD